MKGVNDMQNKTQTYMSCLHYRYERVLKVEDFLKTNGYDYTITKLKSPINSQLTYSVKVRKMTLDELIAYNNFRESLGV
jgi:hypothetical protein